MTKSKCSAIAKCRKAPKTLYSFMSHKALTNVFRMKGDAVKILTTLMAKLAKMRTQEQHCSTAGLRPELIRINHPLRERKTETFPTSGHSRKLGVRQRKISLTVEHESGHIRDYSNSSSPKEAKEGKVKTYFEVDFEDSTCEEEIDIEDLKRILASFIRNESSIQDDGFLTTTLCSTEL